MNTFPFFFQYYRILFQCLLCHSRIRTKSFNNYLGMIWFRRAWPEVDCSDDVGNREEGDGLITFKLLPINLLKPNDIYICRTAALTSRRYILNIYSTNIHTEYFKHAA